MTKVKKMTKVGESQTCQLLRVWRVIKGSNLLDHVRHKVSVSVHLLIKRFQFYFGCGGIIIREAQHIKMENRIELE